MQIYSTTNFIYEYKKLVKIKKHYSCLPKHVSKYIFEDKFQPKGDLLNRSGKVSVYKSRLKSCNNRGKSYGFRFVFLEHPDYNILLTVYPKWGSENTADLKPEEISVLIAEALIEKESNEWMRVSFDEKKKKIEFHQQVEIIPEEIIQDEEE